MNVLQYIRNRYPSGKIRATYRVLEEKEMLCREDVLELRAKAKDGYIDVEELADLLNQI